MDHLIPVILYLLLTLFKFSFQVSPDCPLGKSYALFTTDAIITVPRGVSRARVLLSGGGGGGGSGPASGGASGYVISGVFDVAPDLEIKVIVGKGGLGSTRKVTCDQDSQPGGLSSFGKLIANGGGSHQGTCPQSWAGPSGGTGGGGGCYNATNWCQSGIGGSSGSNGNNATGGQSFGPGNGQGTYINQLNLFCFTQFTAGPGGKGKMEDSPGGGGAGGVFIQGAGPSAGSGEGLSGAEGGKGYGAGGGSGGYLGRDYNNGNQSFYYAGGAGSDGFVYVEWFAQPDNCTYVSGYSVFTSNGQFIVPCGVQQVRALAVGGGSGGLTVGGGGSGKVSSGIFAVSPFQWIQVTVGTGGAGTPMIYGNQYFVQGVSQNSQAGGTSSFGSYLSAVGGDGKSISAFSASSGGSGGGQGVGCYLTPSTSGSGGTNGSPGFNVIPQTCSNWLPGTGQGSFIPLLQIFTRNFFTPGAGGLGNSLKPPGTNGQKGYWLQGGGGGGGVLLNGNGPAGQDGQFNPYSNGFGGKGYGAGGGAGGYYWNYGDSSTVSYLGGQGAGGIVYIEW